jgi:predicted RNA-binding Zn-ribbon protein involved in translation (DUF1610 family)
MPGTPSSDKGGIVEKKDMLGRLIADGTVELTCLTDEEMASINADEQTPFRPAEPPARLGALSADVRTAVLTTALRSLVARGLIQAPGEAEIEHAAEAGARLSLRPFGVLDTILAVRRAPSAVVFVGQASYLAALHAFREEQVRGFLEERIDQRGLHYFTLRSAGQAVETVAALADPGGRAPADGPALGQARDEVPAEITRALRELGPGVTRIDAYHSRPAGTRRIQVSVLAGPGAVSVVWSAFGVAPGRARYVSVNTEGLRQVIRDALTDPGGDSMSDASEQAGPPYRCPVCGYRGLDELPRTEESGASYEICPSCGFEFGVTDDDRGIGYQQWRAEWIAGGMRWWSRRPPPAGWDPRAQLRDLEEPGLGHAGG